MHKQMTVDSLISNVPEVKKFLQEQEASIRQREIEERNRLISAALAAESDIQECEQVEKKAKCTMDKKFDELNTARIQFVERQQMTSSARGRWRHAHDKLAADHGNSALNDALTLLGACETDVKLHKRFAASSPESSKEYIEGIDSMLETMKGCRTELEALLYARMHPSEILQAVGKIKAKFIIGKSDE